MRVFVLGAALAGATLSVCAALASAAPEPQSSPVEIPVQAMEAGEALYLVNCRMCHGTRGTAGTPLAGNDRLRDAEYVARTIITGPGYMTAFGPHLDDEEIALLVTYVRNSWGNAFGPVGPEDVALVR